MNDTTGPRVDHPFADLINMEVTARGDGECRTEVAITNHHLNPNGVVHGAVLYALADTGMGGALMSALPDTNYCSTIEIKINYFRPGTRGTLRAETRVIHQGSRTAAMESEIYDDSNRLLARATGTFMILDRP